MEFEGGTHTPLCFVQECASPCVCSSCSPSVYITAQVIEFKTLAGAHGSKDFWSVGVLAPLLPTTVSDRLVARESGWEQFC
jgi:hypothetical protein